MAICAVFGRGFIEDYRLRIDLADELMTVSATNVAVSPGESKRSALVMIERGGLPLCTIVAVGARSDISPGELFPMRIGVTLLALPRGFGEVGIDQLGAKMGRFVAVDAGHGAMRSQQREIGFGVVETGEILPFSCGMAVFAVDSRAIRSQRFHALRKLVVVRIAVTGGTGNILEVVDRCRPVVPGFGC